MVHSPNPAVKPRRLWRGLGVAALLIGVGIAPAVPTLMAAAVAKTNGSDLHEGFVNPCMIAGQDWGGTLYAMGMSASLMIVALSLAVAGAVLVVVLPLGALGALVRWLRS